MIMAPERGLKYGIPFELTTVFQGNHFSIAGRLIQGFVFGVVLCFGGNANAEEITHEFHINTGLVKPAITQQVVANRKMYAALPPDYAGTVQDAFGVNGFHAKRRIEFRRHYINGKGESWPTLWEPYAFCETLLTKPEPIAGQSHSWRLNATTSGTPMPDTGCGQHGRLGGWFGIAYATVTLEPSGNGVNYTIVLFDDRAKPIAQGTLHQAQTVQEIPSRALFNESQFEALQTLARYPALLTADVTDRHGIIHPLSVHRVHFSDVKRPVLNVYDHYSGCVFARNDPGPGAEHSSRFTLREPIGAATIKHQCNETKALKSYLIGSTFKGGATELTMLGDMVFVRQPDGSHAVTIESTRLLMGDYRGERVGQGTARLTGKEPLYVDYTPVTGARIINDYYLVTNGGLFKIGLNYNNALSAYVHERTDLHSLFNSGDQIASLSWSQLDQKLYIGWMQRTANRKCPDTSGPAETIRFTPTSPGVWSGKPVPDSSNERACFAQEINLRTCKPIRCLQWSDSMTWNNEAIYLASSESEARRLWQSVYKWTRANTGSKYDPQTYKGETVTGNDNSTGPCGDRTCYEELIDSWAVEDIWK